MAFRHHAGVNKMLVREAEAVGRPAYPRMAGLTMSSALLAVRTGSVVAIAGAVLLAGCASGATPPAAGRAVAVVDVQPVEGGTAPNLSDVALRLRQVLSAVGFTDAQADVTGSTRVTVRVDGDISVSQLQSALEPGPLLFRKVLTTGKDASNGSVPTSPGGTAPAEVTLDAVKAAVGNQAWAAAMVVADTRHDMSGISAIASALAPFGRLTPAEVAVLPAAVQFYVPQIGCATLNARARGATDDPQATVVVCDNESVKYMLDVAKVSGSDVGSASSSPGASPAWAVNIAFSSTGARRWSALTNEAFNNVGGGCILTQPAVETGHAPVCEVALVQDNKVLTAAAIQAVLSSEAHLAGSFSQKQATILAAQLTLAGLPVRITVLSVSH
jgi:preprotein translocase subunit SecD